MSFRRLLGAATVAVASLGGCGQSGPGPIEATLQLEIDNCGGLNSQRATAVRLSDDLAATVAHAFAVDDQISVAEFEIFTSDGTAVAADVVYLDLETDIALLRLGSSGPSLSLASYDSEDSSARFVTFSSLGGPASIRAIDVIRLVNVTLDGDGERQALELGGSIAPGDSGAPVLDDDGRIIGIVFAASKTEDVGWAVASFELEAALVALDTGAVAPTLTCPE